MTPSRRPRRCSSSRTSTVKSKTSKPTRWIGGSDRIGEPSVAPRSKKTAAICGAAAGSGFAARFGSGSAEPRSSESESGDGAPWSVHRRAPPRSRPCAFDEGSVPSGTASPRAIRSSMKRRSAWPAVSGPSGSDMRLTIFRWQSSRSEAAVEPGSPQFEGTVRGSDLVGGVCAGHDRRFAEDLVAASMRRIRSSTNDAAAWSGAGGGASPTFGRPLATPRAPRLRGGADQQVARTRTAPARAAGWELATLVPLGEHRRRLKPLGRPSAAADCTERRQADEAVRIALGTCPRRAPRRQRPCSRRACA